MILSHIVAVSTNDAIGKDGKLPWHISRDLKRFKKLTSNHIILMGRKTMESLPFVLPSRFNMVLSRSLPEGNRNGFYIVKDIDSAKSKASSLIAEGWPDEVFCIGGAQIYTSTIEDCERIYLTKVDNIVDGADAFYDGSLLAGFDEKNRQHVVDDASGLNLHYINYEKTRGLN